MSPEEPPVDLPEIPGYRVEAMIGRGGMASVYRATQLSLERSVAIKVMASDAEVGIEQARRFEDEARTIARLDHPSIVGIHEVGRLADGRLYYVMPHLPNGDLAGRDLRSDELAVVAIVRALLQALAHAHAHGIVHRDVKPENVLFDANGHPRLADFGIALGRRRAEPRITREGMALGSTGYMAPEQARGEPLDGRADLYALGVLTYEMLTGQPPYRSSDELTLALMHAQDPLPELPERLRHWQALLDGALAKRPEDRFADARAMLVALDQVEHRIRQSGRRPLGRLLHGFDGRPWLLVMLLGLSVVVLLALWPRPAPPPPEDPVAVEEAAIAEQLRLAAAQADAGALVVPAGANAAETYLGVLRRQPGRADAMNGLRRVFADLAQQVRQAIERGEGEILAERMQQAALLAEGLGALGEDGVATVRDGARRALDAEVAQAVAEGDRARAEAALARYAELGLDDEAARALIARLAVPAPSAASAPAMGAGVPAAVTGAGGGQRWMPAPVSVAEYRRFAEATRRAAARCRARLSPLQLVDQRDWRDPGFPQADASPVVCVSFADAEAYARWLGTQGAGRWRLPTQAERRAGGQASPVAEWTSDCAASPGRSCARRVAFPASSAAGAGQPRDPGRGYDEVGIRLLREG